MSSPIAKLLIALGLDASEVETGVGKTKKSFDGLGLNSQTAFKVVGAAAATGFAFATKGALEAEEAQGKFMAATGATREEAKQFVSGMDSLAGSAGAVGKSFEDIAATGTMVEQQFGTTGQATTELTGHILEFSKVTGQDAAGAAAALEDTLSAFGLEAADAAGVMDQLVASNQKFGTSAGPEALDILNKMAPALTTMGMGLDDGVELLNAFEVAGLDASSAQRGLQTAVQELKPGQNLDDLITQIGAIEDPTLRAQKAIEIFGTKAGVGLAKVIKPGMTSLDEFGVSAEEAAGKTGKAADDMLTFSDRIKSFADKAIAGAREVGQQFGPALMGLSTIASLAAPFAKSIGGLVTAVLPTAKIKGLLIGGAMAEGEIEGATGPQAIKALFTRIGAMSIPLAPAGTTVGMAVGGAISAGMTVGLLGGGAAAVLAPAIASALAKGQVEANLRAELSGQLMAAAMSKGFGEEASTKISAEAMAAFDTAFASGQGWDAAVKAGLAAGEAAASGFPRGLETGLALNAHNISERLESVIDQAVPASTAAAESLGRSVDEAVAAAVLAGKTNIAEDYRETMRFAGQAAYAQSLADAKALGMSIPGEIGQGIQQKANVVLDAAEGLKDLLKNGLTPEERAMKLIGQDYIKLVEQGMHSEIDGAKEAAQSVAIAAINTIEDAGLTGKKGQKGLKAVGIYYDQLLASGMTAEQAATALKAGGVSDATIAAMSTQGRINAAEQGGANIGEAWTRGIAQGVRDRNALDKLHAAMSETTRGMHGQSPPPVGPLRDIDKWGMNVGRAWLGGLAAGIGGSLSRPLSALGQALFPIYGPSIMPTLATAGGPGSVTIQSGAISITVNGSIDPQGTADAVAEKVATVVRDLFRGASQLPYDTSGRPA